MPYTIYWQCEIHNICLVNQMQGYVYKIIYDLYALASVYDQHT